MISSAGLGGFLELVGNGLGIKIKVLQTIMISGAKVTGERPSFASRHRELAALWGSV
jgi:hypothetical protein